MDHETKEVHTWWEENPFTYKRETGVGLVATDDLTIEFFDKCEKKLRRHGPTYQDPGKPLLSNLFDYKKIRGNKVLDIASGTGVTTVEFARQGCQTTAIDITSIAVEMTKKNLGLRGLDADVYQMDAQHLDFDRNTFDFVCAHGCLMHMPDTQKAVNEIHRVLKSKGTVYAWMYHKGFYYWFGILFLRGLLKCELFKYKFSFVRLTSRYSDGAHNNGNPHTKFSSKKETTRYFRDAGFSKVNSMVVFNPIEFNSFPSKRFSFGQYLPITIKSIVGKVMGLGIVITAEK